MRKIKFLGLVLACAMAFVACTSGSADNVPSNQTTQTERVEGSVSEFFPFSPNTQYVFSRSGMISDREEIYVTFINGNIMQRNITVAHLEATEVLEYRDGAIILTHAISGGHEFRNLTNEPANIDRVMLKAPLEVGNSWPAFTGDISLGNLQGTSTITDVNVPVSVPYGDFLAIQVTTEFPGGNFSVEYFVRDIGIVKVEYFTSAQNPEGAANTVDETIMLAEINRNVAREITF
ncbi:MAG: hypothetical protein FWD82_08780, partial [Defluviitaleaceae bacterium]|nr:hypothetical protein [Defluviitaleaceae bacterium]